MMIVEQEPTIHVMTVQGPRALDEFIEEEFVLMHEHLIINQSRLFQEEVSHPIQQYMNSRLSNPSLEKCGRRHHHGEFPQSLSRPKLRNEQPRAERCG